MQTQKMDQHGPTQEKCRGDGVVTTTKDSEHEEASGCHLCEAARDCCMLTTA